MPRSRRPGATATAAPAPSSTPIDCNGVVLERFGGPEVLKWERLSAPPPGPGEVRIRHTAIGVNFIDVYFRTGYYALVAPPGVPGLEGAGVVVDVGPDVHGVLPGDRVGYACLPPGAYAEYRTMKADLLVVLPAEISDETAAAGLLKGMTRRVPAASRPSAGARRHHAGPCGGRRRRSAPLPMGAVHWARTVIGTVGSLDKARVARAHGCAYPIVYTEEDFVEKVQAITGGRGCDVVYDAVGRDTFLRSYEALAMRGHLVSYGQASGPIEPLDIGAFVGKSARVSRPNFGHYTGTPAEVRAITDRLFDAIRRGILTVDIGQRLPLRDAAEAHRALESRRTMGSTILLP